MKRATELIAVRFVFKCPHCGNDYVIDDDEFDPETNIAIAGCNSSHCNREFEIKTPLPI